MTKNISNSLTLYATNEGRKCAGEVAKTLQCHKRTKIEGLIQYIADSKSSFEEKELRHAFSKGFAIRYREDHEELKGKGPLALVSMIKLAYLDHNLRGKLEFTKEGLFPAYI